MKPRSKFYHRNSFPVRSKRKIFDDFSFSATVTIIRGPIRDTGGARSTPDERSSNEQ